MTLLSDRWIKQMCKEQDLIVPYVEKSIKVSEDGTRKIPSYGLSSYGYDVRLGRNFTFFKGYNQQIPVQFNSDGTPSIIKNINPIGHIVTSDGAINFDNYDKVLDICDFDSECGVEIKDADWVIMPPHSFILGHTEEKIKVPRDVSVVCMGKSTIARAGIIVTVTPLEAGWCFTGDTEVALANGESISFKDMVERYNNGERFFGYTFKPDGTVGVEELLNPRKTRQNSDLVEITLDNGERIKCTPDHKFLTKQNEYVEAQHLKENDSLMPLYRYNNSKGYESVASPVFNKTRPVYTHKLSDLWNIENNVYNNVINTVRHHLDFNPKNNYPTNIVRMTDEEHHQVHETKEGYKEERIKTGNLGFKGLIKKLKSTIDKDSMSFDEVVSEHYSAAAKKFWTDDDHRETRDAWLQKHKEPRPNRLKAFDTQIVWKALLEHGSVRAAAKVLKTKADTLFRRFPQMIAQARDRGIIPTNHKVVSVKKLDYKEDVYCLTVPKTSNFALEAGVFVHNCGYVTLEITNTTDIPIKLWSGIGITQLLFQPGNEPCETSYADRGGKYQNQPQAPVMPTN